MKRNLELVRALLLKIEEFDLPQGTKVFLNPSDEALQVSGYTPEQVAYNLELLFDAGLVNGSTGAMDFGIAGLTWKGHEFLDDIRDPEIWRKTRERAKTLAGVGLALLWEIAKGEVKGNPWPSMNMQTRRSWSLPAAPSENISSRPTSA